MDPLSLFFDDHSVVDIRKRNMPHWRQEGKLYFVTWRQADSIPAVKRQQLQREREAFIQAYGDPLKQHLTVELQRRYHQLFSERVQRWIDAGHGSCVLRKPEALKIMRTALHHFQGTRYTLGSFAIAGNHVHVLVAPVSGIGLSEVMHS